MEYERDLRCGTCRRTFRVLDGRMIDLLPSTPRALNPEHFGREYLEYYQRESARPFYSLGDQLPWGTMEAITPKQLQRKQRHRDLVMEALRSQGSPNGVVCDLTGGAGYYTLAAAREARFVLHCDLSLDSLRYTFEHARRDAVENIFFLRVDYLRPPFSGSLDSVLCLDTLIRGWEHEALLLRSIRHSLRPGGTAIVDFHNWWHNPARRLGLLRENFRQNRSYGRSDAERLLAESGVAIRRYVPFHQEADGDAVSSRVLRALLPATRHIFAVG